MSILVFKPTLLKSFHKRVKDRDKNLGLQNENQHVTLPKQIRAKGIRVTTRKKLSGCRKPLPEGVSSKS